jgi:hypothetical protein
VNGDAPTPMATSPPAAALGVPAPRSPVAHSAPKPSPANTLGGGKDNFNNRRDAAFANRDRERGDRDRESQFQGNRDQSFGNRDRPDNFNANRPDAFGGRDRGPAGGPRDNSLGGPGPMRTSRFSDGPRRSPSPPRRPASPPRRAPSPPRRRPSPVRPGPGGDGFRRRDSRDSPPRRRSRSPPPMDRWQPNGGGDMGGPGGRFNRGGRGGSPPRGGFRPGGALRRGRKSCCWGGKCYGKPAPDGNGKCIHLHPGDPGYVQTKECNFGNDCRKRQEKSCIFVHPDEFGRRGGGGGGGGGGGFNRGGFNNRGPRQAR